MANAFFALSGDDILEGDFNFDTDVVSVSLIDTNDVDPNTATHDFYNDIEAAQVATGALDSTTVAAGVFDSSDETFSAVTGDVSEGVDIWINTGGASSTDPLIADYDTFVSGMPVTPNGGDITLAPNASGWFSVI